MLQSEKSCNQDMFCQFFIINLIGMLNTKESVLYYSLKEAKQIRFLS